MELPWMGCRLKLELPTKGNRNSGAVVMILSLTVAGMIMVEDLNVNVATEKIVHRHVMKMNPNVEKIAHRHVMKMNSNVAIGKKLHVVMKMTGEEEDMMNEIVSMTHPRRPRGVLSLTIPVVTIHTVVDHQVNRNSPLPIGHNQSYLTVATRTWAMQTFT